MKPSPERIKSSKPRVRSWFLLPLAVCLLPATVGLPPQAPLPVVAQTIDTRQAEADRLWQQGIQQYQTSQFSAALDSGHQALQLYRALNNIKDPQGKGTALNHLGLTFLKAGNLTEAKTMLVRGLGSAIALAPSGADNGWLTAEEIVDHDENSPGTARWGCFYPDWGGRATYLNPSPL